MVGSYQNSKRQLMDVYAVYVVVEGVEELAESDVVSVLVNKPLGLNCWEIERAVLLRFINKI